METHAQSGDWRITTRGAAILQSRFRTLARPATPFELMDDAVSYYRENFRPLFTHLALGLPDSDHRLDSAVDSDAPD
jgi:hypothetical protein